MEMSETKIAIDFLIQAEDTKEICKHLEVLKEFDEMYHDLINAYEKQGIILSNNVVKI